MRCASDTGSSCDPQGRLPAGSLRPGPPRGPISTADVDPLRAAAPAPRVLLIDPGPCGARESGASRRFGRRVGVASAISKGAARHRTGEPPAEPVQQAGVGPSTGIETGDAQRLNDPMAGLRTAPFVIRRTR